MDESRSTGRNYARQAAILKALGSEPRLRIIERLAVGPQCVCQLTELLGVDQSTVSRHLGVLRSAGIVEGTRRGQHVDYRLLTPCVLSFLECAAAVEQEGDERSGSQD
jgi:ArsR family transcriptional regulator